MSIENTGADLTNLPDGKGVVSEEIEAANIRINEKLQVLEEEGLKPLKRLKKKIEAAQPKKPAHRPSGYSVELANEICMRIMAGRPLSKVCLDDDIPSRDTVHRWLIEHSDFSDNYVRACNIRREYRFETLEDVVDKEDDPARARIKVDVIKWQLSKEEPKKYGDKVDFSTNGKDLPTPILGILPSKNTNSDVIDLT